MDVHPIKIDTNRFRPIPQLIFNKAPKRSLDPIPKARNGIEMVLNIRGEEIFSRMCLCHPLCPVEMPRAGEYHTR